MMDRGAAYARTHNPLSHAPFHSCRYIRFCMDRVQLLQSHGVTPLLVFDGASIPSKRDKNVERRQ